MTTTDHPSHVDVVAATAHPDTRRVDLEDRVVLRTPGRPDAIDGNLVVLRASVAAGEVAAAHADARVRLTDPRTTPRVLVPVDGGPVPIGGRVLDVLVLPASVGDEGAAAGRRDVATGPPADDRAWHGVTVLRRHAIPAGDPDEAAARARGGRDELLRWWVEGRRLLRDEGRARVTVATRFGTPVGTGTLLWAPGAPVGSAHAGLAVVDDVVVHPAHRGLGIGATVLGALVAAHRADFPRALVAAAVPTSLRGPLERRGWRHRTSLADVRDEVDARRWANPGQR